MRARCATAVLCVMLTVVSSACGGGGDDDFSGQADEADLRTCTSLGERVGTRIFGGFGAFSDEPQGALSDMSDLHDELFSDFSAGVDDETFESYVGTDFPIEEDLKDDMEEFLQRCNPERFEELQQEVNS